MKNQILQIESTNSSEFIPKVAQALKQVLSEHSNSVDHKEVLLTRHQTAEMLSISLVTLWKLTKDEIIPAYRLGRKVRYKKSEVLESLKKMNQFEK